MSVNFDLVKAIVFDMDGLLVNSEPYWKKAILRVFKDIGIDLDESLYSQTQGLRAEDLVDYCAARVAWPKTVTKTDVVETIVSEMEYLIGNECELMPGALEAIDAFSKYPCAIASSSPMRLINAFVDRHAIRDKFDFLRSAEFETFGKPYPGVYIKACQDLGVFPLNALAFEDSVNGVLAARAAQMQVVAIPEPEQFERKEFVIAHDKYSSLLEYLSCSEGRDC